ncbi:hypothetical protein Clacol_004521 [Clathrus columnatus]|uniref:FAD-binding PCMH-type domain-containing protein n=1 Tax=Clathrus columnatus TaxID=1419009 RepID=A0AAV5ABK2_9AGAM|nr:hypothetical protein Clacol_004521 [Clathrus columnatus]
MGTFLSCLSKLEGSSTEDLSPQQSQFLNALSTSHIRGKIRKIGSIDYNIDIIPWNLRCTPKPLAVVYPLNAQEVSTMVKIATKYSIPVQPRSGGHSFASYSLGGKDGALVIDLGKMNTVVVNQTTWRATIGGGARLEEVTNGLYDQGKRTIAHGICPQVGIGGHATVGGQGPLSRMYGLTLDHVVEMEVVLADGTITKTDKETNSDLFFALRGAGASFGIVTSFTFETHPVPEAVTHYSFQLTYGTHTELADIFIKWQDFVSSPIVANDRSFNSLINITSSIILIQGSRLGPKKELEASEIFVSLKKAFNVDIKTHELDWLGAVLNWTVVAVESLAGSLTIPLYMKSLCVRQSKLLTPGTVRAWFEYMHTNSPKDALWVIIGAINIKFGFVKKVPYDRYLTGDLQGGRISDFPLDSTAYSLRDSMTETLVPLIPNTLWPKQYWGDNYPRLLDIKKKYDPTNTFSNPQSVGANLRLPPKPAFRVKDSKPVLNL